MKKIKNIIILSIVFLINFSFCFADHYCWRIGPYYYLRNNKYVKGYYDGCSCRAYSLGTVFTFSNVDFDFYVKQPDNVNSVDGKVGFESGTKILLDTHFGFSNITKASSSSHGYKDRVEKKQTKLNGGSYSNATSYTLSTEGQYTLTGRLKDRYPGNYDTDSEDFYVGPYPTVSCKVALTDDNIRDRHYDSIKITDIKLKSTYKPKELRFEIYKDNTYTGKYVTVELDSFTTYSTGFNSKFKDISEPINLGMNFKPSEKINLRVRVVDGRGTGTSNSEKPNSPKYAKYQNTPVF